MSNGSDAFEGYDRPECVQRNLMRIVDLSLQMDALLVDIDHDFAAFDWESDVRSEIILGCFRIAFLVDSTIKADPSYKETFFDQLEAISAILDEFYTNPIEPDEDLFWDFVTRTVPKILDICDPLIPMDSYE